MCTHTTSIWEKILTVATCLQTVAVIISLAVIWSQLNQQTVQLEQQVKLSRAANTQSLVTLITPLNLRVTELAMAELWLKGDCGINKVPDEKAQAIERQQYEMMLASYLVFYENVHSQYRADLLDQRIYDGWDRDLAGFIEQHRIAEHWNNWKDLYRTEFSDRVTQIIASQPAPMPCPK